MVSSFTGRLLLISDTYCASVHRSRSRISTLIFGEGTRLDGIAAGKDLNTRSYEKAMAWFSANWPEGVAWPDGIERPEPVEAAAQPGASETQTGAAA